MKQTTHVFNFFVAHPELDSPEKREVVVQVNRIIDQFAHYPDPWFLERHRKFLHHREGVDYFARRFGELGRMAATQHIREDTGHLPSMEDYALDLVDEYGYRR